MAPSDEHARFVLMKAHSFSRHLRIVAVLLSLSAAWRLCDMLQAPTDKALMRMLDECAKGIPTARDVLSFFRSQGVYDLKGVSQLTRQDIDAMVQEGCNTPVFDGMERTALKSHISALTTQAQTRLDENAQSQKLYDAANDGRTADVLELIRNQTNIDAHVYPNVGGYEHPDGVSVLMVASFRGYDDIVRILCENAAHIDDVGKVLGWSALMLASAEGHVSVVRDLIEHGATVDLTDSHGRTALMKSSRNGHDSIVRVLLEAGAQVDRLNFDGRSALMWACAMGFNGVVQVLLEYHADPLIRDNKWDIEHWYGYSALDYAARSRDDVWSTASKRDPLNRWEASKDHKKPCHDLLVTAMEAKALEAKAAAASNMSARLGRG
eukprot:CAMPEP_0179440798 /NCGR_PEP_ID=MMETSP0799-20121207/24399_1 /TAXON_ID=46947 /ORGANISM="Geminigera cryophila, Strain CCMP2564" /LENGTH=379 /DNA_ID=CAMNT_0021224511 /DNA_START=113 /DNA_END=1249 /DNA_ORIENTATION=+